MRVPPCSYAPVLALVLATRTHVLDGVISTVVPACVCGCSLDRGDGILVLSELELAGRLTKLKFSDIITMEKLREVDDRKTGTISARAAPTRT